MKIETNELGNTVLRAEDGMALCPANKTGPTSTTLVYLARGASPSAWKDCEYAEDAGETATEADKDAALETLGVDMTEG